LANKSLPSVINKNLPATRSINLPATSSDVRIVGQAYSQQPRVVTGTARTISSRPLSQVSKFGKFLKPVGRFLGPVGALLTAVDLENRRQEVADKL